MRPSVPWIAVCGLALLPTPARASVTSCTVSAGEVAFGAYSPLSAADLEALGTVQVTCSGTASAVFTLALSPGRRGTFIPRAAFNGAAMLSYNLFTDLQHVQIWGDGSSGTLTRSGQCALSGGTGSTCSVPFTIYGRMPAHQRVPAGSYLDTLILTVTF